MTERQALLLAGGLHALLLAILSLSLASPLRPSMTDPDVTPIEFVDIADVATTPERARPSMDAAPRDPGPPPPEPEPLLPEPPAPAAVPEPRIAPAPPPPQPASDTAIQDTVAAVRPPPPSPRSQPAPRREALDPGAMAALIDRSRPEAPTPVRDPDRLARTVEQAIPRAARLSPIQAATLEQAIRAQIAPCWNPPIGGADVAEMTAVLRIRLNRDGSVAAPPDFVSQTGATAGNQAYARAFVESARRAVLRCAPLQLPDDLFAHWRDFELNFDPRLMT